METEKKNPFEISLKLAKNLANIEFLGKVKDVIASVKDKKFFTYKPDEFVKGVYHIYFEDKFVITQKFLDANSVEKYVGILEYGFQRGVAYSLEGIVDAIHKDVKES